MLYFCFVSGVYHWKFGKMGGDMAFNAQKKQETSDRLLHTHAGLMFMAQ
jgi:hypothetical protein